MAAAGAGSPIPARPAALRTGEGAEEGLGSLMFRFLAGVQVGAAPGVGRGGGLCSGHCSAGAGELTAGMGSGGGTRSLIGSKETCRGINWPRSRVGRRLYCGGAMAGWRCCGLRGGKADGR
jgi:hypothetical protein